MSEREKQELKELANSAQLRLDSRRLRENRNNPFMEGNKINLDNFLVFLDEFNSFMNHCPKPFRKIIDRDMRL